MRSLVAFVPSEIYLVLLVVAGLAVIVGAKRLAGAVVLIVLAGTLLPVVLEPLFNQLAAWPLVLLLALLGFGVLRAIFALLLGKRATDHMVGILAADVIKKVLAAPFPVLRYLMRLLLPR